AAFRHGEDEIQAEVRADVQEGETAVRSCGSQVGKQRNRFTVAVGRNDGRGVIVHVNRALGNCAADCVVTRAKTEPELRTDIASEGARGGYDAGFDLNFRSLSVQGPQKRINLLERTWDIFNDQRIAAGVGHNITARRKELLDNGC